MDGVKYLLIGAGATALFFGTRYVLRLNRLSNELDVSTQVAIYNVNLSGLDLRIVVMLRNPTGGSVKVKHPFIRVMHGAATLASSVMKDVDIDVPGFTETKLEPIILNIGFLSLATSAPTLLKEYRDTGRLEVTVKTTTTINNTIPFSKSDVISIAAAVRA